MDLGLNRTTVIRAIGRLAENGHLWDLTPIAIKRSHEYRVNIPESGTVSGTATVPEEINLVQNSNQSGTVLRHKDIEDTNTKARGKKKTPPDPRVKTLLAQYQKLIGYTITAYAKEGSAAKWLLKEGYTMEQIFGCWHDMATEDFWKGKHISLQSVKNRIGPWVSKGGNGRGTIDQAVKLDLPPTVFEEEQCQRND